MNSWQRSQKRPVVMNEQFKKMPLDLLAKCGAVRRAETIPSLRKPPGTSGTTQSFSGTSRNKTLQKNTGRKQEKKLKKNLRVDLGGKPLRKTIQLRALKVGQKTLHRYLSCINLFEAWAKTKFKKVTCKTLDKYVNEYLHELHSRGAELSEATYLVYGLQLLKCEVPKEQFLTVSKMSLAGWRKQQPGNMRVPVPEEYVFDLAMHALDQQRFDIAMALILQYDGYLRPSECLSLTVEHVSRPQGRKYPHWALIIAPSSLDQVTKTGKSDDSILIGDRPHNRWICACLAAYMEGVEHQLFPALNLAMLERWCKQSCRDLQYKTDCISPHIMRHAGPSNDSYHQRRSLTDIQKRGRWAAKSSVSRYEKHALLLKQWKLVASHRKSLVMRRSQDISGRMTSALRKVGR